MLDPEYVPQETPVQRLGGFLLGETYFENLSGTFGMIAGMVTGLGLAVSEVPADWNLLERIAAGFAIFTATASAGTYAASRLARFGEFVYTELRENSRDNLNL